MDADVLLWQEIKWTKKVCAWEDLLAVLAGEKLGLRQPGKKPIQHRNLTPMFYTARRPLAMISPDPVEVSKYNQATAERFNMHTWATPLPLEERRDDFPRCGRSFSKFVSESEEQSQCLAELSD